MNKRQVIKYLMNEYQAKKVNFGDHDLELTIKDKTYYLVFIKIGKNAQLTINSKTHFEVSQGKLDGIRFIKKQSTLHNFMEYSKRSRKIVYLLGTPFRTLQYLNESDIIDITGQTHVHDYWLFQSVKDFEQIYMK